MAKYRDKRFYFENLLHDNDSIEKHLLEINEVVNTSITDALLIQDYVKHEVMSNEDSCDLCLTVSRKSNIEEIKVIHKIWWLLLNEKLTISDELRLGIWKSQREILGDLISKPEVKNVDDYGEQIFVTLQLSPEIIDYLKISSFGESSKLNWSDFILYGQADGACVPLFTSTHFGHDNRIYNLKKTEVENMLSLLDGNWLQIDIRPTDFNLCLSLK